jgi:SAM-dependent methyltransferase
MRPFLQGIATYFPRSYHSTSRSTGGTNSARYCYSVWLRHLAKAHENGLSTQLDTLAELGPGDSLGVGLAALLSGATNYYAFDIVEYASNESNVKIFDELLSLFEKREKIPNEAEFPRLGPYLESYEFPGHILTNERLKEALNQTRIESIRRALLNWGSKDDNLIRISYYVPWYDPNILKAESVDMIYSQAVLEHIDDLAYTYETLYRWLKPGGFMSHQIDFKCHETAKTWNGHWAYSDFAWKLIRGKQPYLINRQPHSTHINLMLKAGYEIACDDTIKDTSGIQRKRLAPKFRNMTDDDLTTRAAFVQVVKKLPDRI